MGGADDDQYLRIIRSLSVEQKLDVAWRLRETAWDLVATGIRARHPELSSAAVQDLVRETFTRAAT